VLPPASTQAKDDTLSELMNPARVHAESTAMTSPIRREQSQVFQDGYEDGGQEDYYEDDDPGQQPYEDDDGYDDGYDDLTGQGQQQPGPDLSAFQQPLAPPQPQPVVTLEDEAIQKAKYLVRMEQLKDRGIKPDKNYDARSSMHDLKMGTLRMEVIDLRQKRIEQGRSALLMVVSTIETGCNYVDDKAYLGDFKLHMRGFNNHVFDDISMYDDCLEQGVEELLGPMENRKWYVELLRMLVASMVMYSYTNRRNHQNTVRDVANQLRNDPDFMQSVRSQVIQDTQQTKTDKDKDEALERAETVTFQPPVRKRSSPLLEEIDPKPEDTIEMVKGRAQTTTV
jgi:hypothetical protein